MHRRSKIQSHAGSQKARRYGRWPGLALLAAMLITALVLWPTPACSFDLPNYDPWYFQSSAQGYAFTVPDKAQHFYGSAILNEIGKNLPFPGVKVTGPLVALSAGFMYEVWQDQQGIGFSNRDLIADAAGIAASQLSSDDIYFWLDYSIPEQVIKLNVGFRLDK